jgi:polar amino acid transport system substrate-binding protein
MKTGSAYRRPVVVFLVLLWSSLPGLLQGEPLQRKLIIGVYSSPPFDIHKADGPWSGLSIELWQHIASDLKLDYEFKEINLTGRFTGLTQGWLDVSVGPITITAEREEEIDFTHTFFVSGLAVAVPASNPESGYRLAGWITILYHTFFSWEFLKVVGGLLALLVFMSVLMWLCEHQKNPSEFGGRGWVGLGSSVWWSAVTMTGVGYGDLAPKTLIGRSLAIIWMFASLLLVAGFTASMASILTAERLANPIAVRTPEDLKGLKLGAEANATSARYLEDNHLAFRSYFLTGLMEALKDEKIQAAVCDYALLRYQEQTNFRGQIKILPIRLDQEYYGFAVREGSPLREEINRALLRRLAEPGWQKSLVRYFGTDLNK